MVRYKKKITERENRDQMRYLITAEDVFIKLFESVWTYGCEGEEKTEFKKNFREEGRYSGISFLMTFLCVMLCRVFLETFLLSLSYC